MSDTAQSISNPSLDSLEKAEISQDSLLEFQLLDEYIGPFMKGDSKSIRMPLLRGEGLATQMRDYNKLDQIQEGVNVPTLSQKRQQMEKEPEKDELESLLSQVDEEKSQQFLASHLKMSQVQKFEF